MPEKRGGANIFIVFGEKQSYGDLEEKRNVWKKREIIGHLE